MPSVVERSGNSIFADDALVVCHDNSINVLQRDLNAIQNWLMIKKLTLNAEKSVLVDFNNKSASRCYIELNSETLMSQAYWKYRGVYVNNKLTFVDHIQKVSILESAMWFSI